MNNGNSYAVPLNYMSAESLTIGDGSFDYGCQNTDWNASPAGLLMECLNNTEIAIHDFNSRLSSVICYEGALNRFTMGKTMGTCGAISGIISNGNISTMSSLNVSGLTTLSNNTTINGILNVSGDSTFKNDTTFLSTFNVSGFTTLKNNTTITGKLNITGNLDCNGVLL
jgi:hypothetical protein